MMAARHKYEERRKAMISLEHAQLVLDTLKGQNDLLRRRIAQRKQRGVRALETKYEREYEYEYECEYEQPHFALPELDAVLEGTEREAEQLMAAFRL
jgi:hypothetical protein